MSRSKVVLFVSVLLLLTLSLPTLAQEANGFAINVVVALTGDAWIHRDEWVDLTAYEPLSLGDFVDNADIIEPDPGVEVRIQCADGQIVVIANIPASPSLCSPLPPRDMRTAMRGNDPSRVLLIYPLYMISEARPTIRWRGLEGYTRYSVQMTRGDQLVWSESYIADGASMAYPDAEEGLLPGGYSVTVAPVRSNNTVVENRSTVQGVVVDLERISVIDDVLAARDFAEAQDSDIMHDYVRALLLAEIGYYWDAITTLETALGIDAEMGEVFDGELPETNTLRGSPEPYLQLGEWYKIISLNEFAIVSFQTALRLAQARNLRESEARALAELSQLQPELAIEGGSEFYCNLERAAAFLVSVGESNGFAAALQSLMRAIEAQGGAAYEC